MGDAKMLGKSLGGRKERMLLPKVGMGEREGEGEEEKRRRGDSHSRAGEG